MQSDSTLRVSVQFLSALRSWLDWMGLCASQLPSIHSPPSPPHPPTVSCDGVNITQAQRDFCMQHLYIDPKWDKQEEERQARSEENAAVTAGTTRAAVTSASFSSAPTAAAADSVSPFLPTQSSRSPRRPLLSELLQRVPLVARVRRLTMQEDVHATAAAAPPPAAEAVTEGTVAAANGSTPPVAAAAAAAIAATAAALTTTSFSSSSSSSVSDSASCFEYVRVRVTMAHTAFTIEEERSLTDPGEEIALLQRKAAERAAGSILPKHPLATSNWEAATFRITVIPAVSADGPRLREALPQMFEQIPLHIKDWMKD